LTSTEGVHTERRNGITCLYKERQGLHAFLEALFESFDVAVFTCDDADQGCRKDYGFHVQGG
jgi:hypothetical protein